MSKTGRPQKSSDDSRSESVKFRLTKREKAAFKKAAELAGIGLSTWVRERLRKAARNELEEAGLTVPFVDKRFWEEK